MDHEVWWETFKSLVASMPRKAESSRLSDDPAHEVQGQLFSIRDCATNAIQAAYEENQIQVALDYEEQAKSMILSFDKRVYTRVRRVFDKQRLKYLTICAGCLFFAVILGLILLNLAQGSTGLTVLIVVCVIFSFVSAGMAALAQWRKQKILLHRMGMRKTEEPENLEEQQ